MSAKTLNHHVVITYDLSEGLLKAFKDPNFDDYAYLLLRVKLNISHTDAFEFASRFRLTGTDASMNENYLIHAISAYEVTVNEILDFEDRYLNGWHGRKHKKESQKTYYRNLYLHARGLVSHGSAVCGHFHFED